MNIEFDEEFKKSADDESNWLVSYADMMTLLCGFFILLFSMSQINPPEYKRITQAISEQFGGKIVSDQELLARQISEVLKEKKIDERFDIRSDSLGVVIVFESTLFFETLNAEVSPAGLKLLNEFAQIIYNKQDDIKKKYKIIVEGHSDSRPITSSLAYASNWELSAARAARVVRIFLAKGFSPQNLAAIGYADTHPILPDKKSDGTWDERGLSKNRRVVIRLIDPSIQILPTPEKLKK